MLNIFTKYTYIEQYINWVYLFLLLKTTESRKAYLYKMSLVSSKSRLFKFLLNQFSTSRNLLVTDDKPVGVYWLDY